MNIWKHSVMKNFDERTGGTTIPRKLRITYVQFFVLGIYLKSYPVILTISKGRTVRMR